MRRKTGKWIMSKKEKNEGRKRKMRRRYRRTKYVKTIGDEKSVLPRTEKRIYI